jgi:mRNA interferase MazF
MMTRGDVVIVNFPYQDGTRGKTRPALVVQCDRNNGRLQSTILAMISGNVQRANTESTQLLIDPTTAEGKQSGLHWRSVVKCENLFTVLQSHVVRTIGHLSSETMVKVEESLKASLALK